MNIRPGTSSDIPEIVSLLKASLGETFLPKSEGYWRWKHVDNPFGQSPVLVAAEEDRIIGVRAFMRWSWSNKSDKREAVRAVDTATHPSAQGKGIFTKLTMSLIKESEQQKLDLVFNTPNEKSMPGYLKMGWEKAGQLPIEVNVARPINMMMNVVTKKKLPEAEHAKEHITHLLSHPGLMDLINRHHQQYSPGHFVTAYSPRYMQWRYIDIPVAAYNAAGIESNGTLKGLFVYRVKHTRWGREFRITDLFAEGEESLCELKKMISREAEKMQGNFITCSGAGHTKLLPGILSYKTRKLGPIVTVRDILPSKINGFKEFTAWTPSLGDMELF
jgi:predicted acetyltransferase